MQHTIKFFRDLQLRNPPIDVGDKLLRQVTSPRTAMRLSLQSAGMKRWACAQMLGISEGYMSKLISGKFGKHPNDPRWDDLPEWFAVAFCWATRCNLLSQYLAAHALDGDDEAALERRLIEQMQRAA